MLFSCFQSYFILLCVNTVWHTLFFLFLFISIPIFPVNFFPISIIVYLLEQFNFPVVG